MKDLAVVVPAFNEEAYLPAQLDAVLEQSPAEVVVVDDCSTDRTAEIAGAYAEADPRVRVVRTEHNLGCNSALNHGLARVGSPYVYFAGANDLVLPGAFSALMALADGCPDCPVLTGDIALLAPNGAMLERRIGWRAYPGYVHPGAVRAGLATRIVHGGATAFRVDALRSLGGFVPPLLWLADTWTQHVLALRHGLCYAPHVVSAARIHADQLGGRIENPSDRERVGAEWVRLLNDPGYADVRDALLTCGLMGIHEVKRPVESYLESLARRQAAWGTLSTNPHPLNKWRPGFVKRVEDSPSAQVFVA